ncbi:amino acid ABC transporter permease [Labrys sp. ZIDIC5]|uniref:amino acid ABC transporter permease n=1 Tax=Labrys sedimenti TaxID=3106036 RepID=UPI002ACA6602|nr:amino acid ABC transporter permease [Labrys sp. ZIDIC5]MDZ5454508.1 amino acid ABC transporter permease [Labrys sp. ZIDIC5]
MNKAHLTPVKASTIDPGKLTVVPLRHPWRWAAVVLVVIAVIMMVRSAISNPEFQWPIVAGYLFNPLVMNGLLQTVVITTVVMVLAAIGGTIAALMMLSPSKLLSVPAAVFVWLFRGTPVLVQLILWYNLSLIVKAFSLWLPGYGMVFSVATNDIMTPFLSAVVALSLHEAGYMAEIIRGGLKSVSQGQAEAAACLGMKPSLALRRIVLPQAMRMIIPPTGNETINLLKTTSLVSIIAVNDLLYSAQAIYARTFETIPLLIVVTFWYLVIVSVMSIGQYYLERHFSRDEYRNEASLFSTLFGNAFRLRRKEVAA